MSRAVAVSRVRSVAGPLRRAHPASGATWNVQVVRGKMSTKCLWHACRALSVGLLLMLLGAAMATIGYYADSLSMAHELRGNTTVFVRDETKGFHLNNLSYAGPIIMGVGGFIVVAACVMTFEARDSAAKVTPARGTGRAHTRAALLSKPARRDLPTILHPIPLQKHQDKLKHKRQTGSAPDLRIYPETVFVKRNHFRPALSLDGGAHSEANNKNVWNDKKVDCEQKTIPLDIHASDTGECQNCKSAEDNVEGTKLRVPDITQGRRKVLERQTHIQDEITHE